MKVGILGGGQLGRMTALAGYPLGLRFRFMDTALDVPVAQLGELVVGDFEDTKLLTEFAQGIDVITYEFENVPAAATRFLKQFAQVYPPTVALEAAQDRISEKSLFVNLQIPTPKFKEVNTEADFQAALEEIGVPSILKTRRMGYDGKGQAVILERNDAENAWQNLKGKGLILEEFIAFDRELSVIAVRAMKGETVFYSLTENKHREGILRVSKSPAPTLSANLQSTAEGYVKKILDKLSYVGVFTLELFEKDGKLFANEMACRVHNSGHWTIEGAETSQFENHLRAVTSKPLGSVRNLGFSAMLNIIGELPDLNKVLSFAGAHLHLYGKSPRKDRKLGHITLCSQNEAELNDKLIQIQKLL